MSPNLVTIFPSANSRAARRGLSRLIASALAGFAIERLDEKTPGELPSCSQPARRSLEESLNRRTTLAIKPRRSPGMRESQDLPYVFRRFVRIFLTMLLASPVNRRR
jgi:hypothetical protein